MKLKRFIFPFLFILLSGCDLEFRNEPSLLTLNYDHLLEAKDAFSKNSPLYIAAFQRLIKEADNALNLTPYSVTQKAVLPPSGDKCDYMSQAPYWWPDPSKPDGLPYTRRDGIRNPEVDEGRFDRHRLELMTDDVTTLTLAWFFTGEEKYASKASNLIETWFFDPENGVNPNLTYAQAIPGIVDGRGIGIIDTRRYIEIIDAVKLLEASPAWNRRMTKKLKDWFSEYLQWLLTSENGKEERSKENNHGTWYDVQVACYAMYTGNSDLVTEILNKSCFDRIDNQIDSLGRQRFELERTNAYGYSVFNLEAIILLGKMGVMMSDEFWDYNPSAAGKVKLACDFLFSYIDSPEEWPYQQISPLEWPSLLPLVVEANKIFEAPEYNRYINYLEQQLNSNNRMIITNI